MKYIDATVDMSCDFTVIAPKDWVIKNCPEILGSKFELPLTAEENRWGTPFIEDYENNIGLYWFSAEEDSEDNGWSGIITDAEFQKL